MPVLDDLIRPNLKLIVCGSAVGKASAQKRAYYAGPGNKFWWVLNEVGLTPVRLSPSEFNKLLDHGIGLTDLAKEESGNDDEISSGAYNPDALRERIIRNAPARLAFNGKNPARAFLNNRTGPLDYGRQDTMVGTTQIWVLPSTSGAANGYWSIAPWQEIASD